MYDRILIFLSEESTFRTAVAEGVSLAKVHAAQVVFGCVLPTYAIPLADMPMATVPLPDEFQQSARRNAEAMLRVAAGLAQEAGVACSQEVVQGPEDAATVLQMAQTQGCQLIVLASAGQNAVVRLISGSVIPGLITLSPMPLLICRGVPRNPRPSR